MDCARDGARSGVLTAMLLVLLCIVFFAGTGTASAAVPSRPTAKAPTGVLRSSWVTFKWTKALRATSYQVRVYVGPKTRVASTSPKVKTLSWTSSSLGDYYDYTWQVRGWNRSGAGRWSKLLPYFHIDSSLWDDWDYWLSDPEENRTYADTLWIRDDRTRTYKRWTWSGVAPVLGTFTEKGNWRATATTIKLTNRLETWVPDEGDESGIAAYEDEPQPDLVWSYVLGDWEYSDGHQKMIYRSIAITDNNAVERKYWRHTGVTD